jgi:DNA-binding CsgD family transcriptional regulator
VLQSLYDLTPAETRLAVEMANGRDLDEISEHFGISKHTVRAQLKAVFQKTDTRRQAELVKLLLTLPLAGG